jgi:L,D-transpeptidase YcbB
MALATAPCRLAGAFVLALALALPATAARGGDASAQIRLIISETRHPALKWPDFRFYDDEMQQFYEPLSYGLAWFDHGRPKKQVPEIITVLAGAGDRGLDPSDYDVSWLKERWTLIREGRLEGDAELAPFDAALSLNLFRYVSDVHIGKINPRNVGFEVNIERKKYDLPVLVREAVARDDLPAVLAAAEPQYPMYGRLKQALHRYRALAADTTLQPLPAVQKKLEPGQPYAGAARLARLLAALGDLSAGAGADGLYDAHLAEAVKRFQDRHGLAPDGVIGKATLEQLNVPLSARVRQIELALERMRWLPTPAPGPVIGINIPEFKLWAFDDDHGRLRVAFRMSVVVGKAVRTQTPVFEEEMRYVVFSPYWNVPLSIARKEIVPALRNDPAYLAKHDMELVGSANGAPVDEAASEATLEAIRHGELRVRQRPGPMNALGGVKFIFPNQQDVYLHDTPVRTLFVRDRRDFSHGCIRVADAVKLARFVLRGAPEWTDERIAQAMAEEREKTVRLPRPIPVVIFYTTVIVEEDGTVRFLRDIYGHDRALDAALKAGYPYPP